MKAAIFAIALDEERYLSEWIQYHTELGFTDFVIYDNSANNRLLEYASDSVKVLYYPGKGVQISAYNHFINNLLEKIFLLLFRISFHFWWEQNKAVTVNQF